MVDWQAARRTGPPDGTFDYMIVGGGASGPAIANRLSAQSGGSVLMLEAGVSGTASEVGAVGAVVRRRGSEMDWQFATEPQAGMRRRTTVLEQGKVLGGGTVLNAMMYVRGNRRNFEMWIALGADGWSYEEVLPYFRRSEDFEGGASAYHGVGGPLRIRVCPDSAMRSAHFQNAAVELGDVGPECDSMAADRKAEPAASISTSRRTANGRVQRARY